MPKRSFDYAKTLAKIKSIGESVKENDKPSTLRNAHIRIVQNCARELNRPNWLEDWQRSELVSILMYSANNSQQYAIGLRYIDLYCVPLPGLEHVIFLENAGVCAMRTRNVELAQHYVNAALNDLANLDARNTHDSPQKLLELKAKLLLRDGQLAGIREDHMSESILNVGLAFARKHHLVHLEETFCKNLVIAALRCGNAESAVKFAKDMPKGSPWQVIANAHMWIGDETPGKVSLPSLTKHAKRHPILHQPLVVTWVLWTIVSVYRALGHKKQCFKWCQAFFLHQARYGIIEPELTAYVRACREWAM